MILAIDVYYAESTAKIVGVLFEEHDETPKEIITEQVSEIMEYVPGEFYKRELPCILKILEKVNLKNIEFIIVDGHVYVDNDKKLGLGGHLWESLNKEIPIIGVAKKHFYNTEEVSFPVFRGESKNPLYVSSVGVDSNFAIDFVLNMKGKFRFPSILKILDKHTRID